MQVCVCTVFVSVYCRHNNLYCMCVLPRHGVWCKVYVIGDQTAHAYVQLKCRTGKDNMIDSLFFILTNLILSMYQRDENEPQGDTGDNIFVYLSQVTVRHFK